MSLFSLELCVVLGQVECELFDNTTKNMQKLSHHNLCVFSFNNPVPIFYTEMHPEKKVAQIPTFQQASIAMAGKEAGLIHDSTEDTLRIQVRIHQKGTLHCVPCARSFGEPL